MNICVCFKITADLDQVLAKDWAKGQWNQPFAYAGQTVNTFDEAALELGLQLKEQGGDDARAIAITLGTARDAQLKNLYAVGYDEVIQIPAAEREFSQLSVAKALAGVLQETRADIILTGNQAGMADSATVPLLMGEILDIPCFTDVITVHSDDDKLTVKWETEDQEIISSLKPPVVLSVGNAEKPYLRLATLKAKMAAKKLTVSTGDEFTAENGKPPERCAYELQARACKMIDVAAAAEGVAEIQRIMAGRS